jgi:hypothetical protein
MPFAHALKVATPSAANAVVLSVKDTEVAPEATDTEVGRVSSLDVVLRLTVVPPLGAGLVVVSRHVAFMFGPKAPRLHCTDDTRTSAVSEMLPVVELLLSETVTVAVVSETMAATVMLNCAVVAPAVATTDAGTVNNEDVELTRSVLPPVAAGFDRTTEQLLLVLGVMVVGVHCIDVTKTGVVKDTPVTVELPFRDAVRVAVVSLGIAPVLIVKIVDVAPAATVSVAGAVSRAEVEVIATALPPAGAGFERLTVQLPLVFGSRAVGVHCIDVTMGGAKSEMVVTAELPFREAVTVAVLSA